MVEKLRLNSRLRPSEAATKSRYVLTGLVGACLSSFAAHAQQKPEQADTLRQKREQAVLAARAGKLIEAISQLEQLALQAPKDMAVKADLIVLLRQAGRNQQINDIGRTLLPDDMPDYALMPWIAALRDTQAYGRAELLILKLKQRLRVKPGSIKGVSEQNLDIYLALVRVESGQKQAARRTVNALSRKRLSADQYAQIAYIYRQLDDPLTCLNYTDIALSMDADNHLALQQMVAALTDIGASTRAYDIASQYPALFPPALLLRLHSDTVVLQLKDAVSEYNRLSAQGQAAQGRILLDSSLRRIEQALASLPQDNPQHLRLSYDYVYGLRVRERMQDVITAFQQLMPEQQQQAPAYVRRALADAYLALQQPQQALALYQQLLNENEQPDPELYTTTYYAYIESENYSEAAPILQKLDREVPAFRYSEQRGADPVANWQRLDIDQLTALDSAYRNQLDKAEQQLAGLYARAPKNSGIMSNYATVLNWRGLPQQADAVVQLAQASDPDSTALALNSANNARDLQQYPRWQQTLAGLLQDIPDNSGVQRNLADWQDRLRPSIESRLNFGRSRADQQTSTVNGSQDAEWYTRLNSPWLQQHWRLFAEDQVRYSDFADDSETDQRAGVGVEWQKERKNAWLKLSQQMDGSEDMGLSLGWSHWLNDNWRYQLSYARRADDVPLRAVRDGVAASAYGFGVDWRANESRQASFSYRMLDMTDNNRRQSFSAAGSQRVFASAHHITTAGVNLYYEKNSYEKNSLRNVSYFNPQQSQSVGLSLSHDWISWRQYERDFTQHFAVSGGVSRQSGYSHHPYVDFLYKHDWQLSRRWSVNYGMGWGSRAYDDSREQRLYAVLGLTGVF